MRQMQAKKKEYIEFFNAKNGNKQQFEIDGWGVDHRGVSVAHQKTRIALNALMKLDENNDPIFYLLTKDNRFPRAPVVNNDARARARAGKDKINQVAVRAKALGEAQAKQINQKKD